MYRLTKPISVSVSGIFVISSLLLPLVAGAQSCEIGGNCFIPVEATCSVSPTSAPTFGDVTWTVTSVTGGVVTGSTNAVSPFGYSYNWSGSDNLSGITESVTWQYATPGSKSGTVTVSANNTSITGLQATVFCGSTGIYAVPQCSDGFDNDSIEGVDAADPDCTGASDNSETMVPLNGSCSVTPSCGVADTTTFTWNASATGGRGNYEFNWLDGGNLVGQGTSFAQSYSIQGTKTLYMAVVSDGFDEVSTCSVQVVASQNLCSGGGGNTGPPPDSGGGTVSVGTIQNPLSINSINEFLAKVLGLLVQLLVPIIVLFYVVTGLMFVTARGKPEKLALARKAFLYTTVGAAIVLGAWVLAEVISNTIDAIQG